MRPSCAGRDKRNMQLVPSARKAFGSPQWTPVSGKIGGVTYTAALCRSTPFARKKRNLNGAAGRGFRARRRGARASVAAFHAFAFHASAHHDHELVEVDLAVVVAVHLLHVQAAVERARDPLRVVDHAGA